MRLKPWASSVLSLEAGSGTRQIGSYEVIETKAITQDQILEPGLLLEIGG